MEQGRRSRAFGFSKIWPVTYMEPEEALPLIISLQALN
jgi:hypothetical protein